MKQRRGLWPRIFALLNDNTERRFPTLGLATMTLFEPADGCASARGSHPRHRSGGTV